MRNQIRNEFSSLSLPTMPKPRSLASLAASHPAYMTVTRSMFSSLTTHRGI